MSHGVPRVSGGSNIEKSEQAREKERRQIDSYKALERDVRQRMKEKDYSNTTLQLTSQLLTLNPEYYTIWNDRRIILLDVFARELSTTHSPPPPSAKDTTAKDTTASSSSDKDKDLQAARAAGLTPAQHEIALLIREDLTFLLPLLKQFPKCYWIWNHRSWLLRSATARLPAHTTLELWRGELGLVGKMLALDRRNFHGWGYRGEVVGELERVGDVAAADDDAGDGVGVSVSESLAEEEFAYTTRMITTDLSNFSAWHYRSQLLPRVLRERKASPEARREVLEAEFEIITRALYTDPYDQSLWFYHQFLMSTFDEGNPRSGSLLAESGNAESVRFLEREIEGVREMLDGAEDCKYIYQALLEYSLRYLELGGEKEKVSPKEMRAWLGELRKLDPLREGRWRDMEMKIPVS